MNSITEQQIRMFLTEDLRYPKEDCGTVLDCMTFQAVAAGHDLDDRFARASLGAGPEARVASQIVGRALGGSGLEVPEYAMRKQIDEWIRKNPRKGR